MNKLCRLLSNPFLVQLKHGLAKGGQTQVFFNGKYPFSIGKMKFSLSFFRLLWRSIFVVLVTILGMTMPFSNERLTLLGSTGGAMRWLGLKTFSLVFMLLSMAIACAAIHGMNQALCKYKFFIYKE
ncbi:hypothetical protein JHK82_039830 [Glycine max]|uniref:Uncharacterized protein n=2 Tax=Glycine subgen. Soja TaxID=1462606 RepID=A0A0R0GKF6_SOYBN|nr:hypothetical protein JHK86_040026 [Glycine max]RZB68889.1 hypothetical protein D0Y65_038603 [Glycine soja]KAG4965625.1 hypothetical protein JHK85_040600 [Glycine max]KAG5110607.1 hypothetical protein JHK82_039830 [Glycine max]KAG5121897.1 hypothetical protein JHK84_040237 [Glycine max]